MSSRTKLIEHDKNQELAVLFLGYKWIAFNGKPVKSHPDYPKDMRVRRLFSPEQLDEPRWADWLKERNAEPATGEEPLSYCYCSSQGFPHVPNFVVMVQDFRL